MTIMDFVWAFVGLLLCAVILTVVCLGIMLVVLLMFREDSDIEIEYDDWEEEQ